MQIAEAAAAAWAGQASISDQVEVHITHYAEVIAGDLDNLTKPIQDALQGVVFLNDRQVRDLRGRRRDIDAAYRVRFISKPLAAAFADGRPFVHILVRRSPVTEELD